MTEERLKEIEELARTGGAARWPDEIQALVAEVRRLRGALGVPIEIIEGESRLATALEVALFEETNADAELRDFREAVEAFLEPQHSHHLNTDRLKQTLAKWSRP